MKRRGFLGVLAGGAVAGPAMVKEAAAKVAEDMALGKAGMLSQGVFGVPGSQVTSGAVGSVIDQVTRGRSMLAKLGKMTAADRARAKAGQTIYAFDPDIASYRSIALHAKLDWQRERQLERIINDRRAWWQRLADGLDPYEDSPL